MWTRHGGSWCRARACAEHAHWVVVLQQQQGGCTSRTRCIALGACSEKNFQRSGRTIALWAALPMGCIALQGQAHRRVDHAHPAPMALEAKAGVGSFSWYQQSAVGHASHQASLGALAVRAVADGGTDAQGSCHSGGRGPGPAGPEQRLLRSRHPPSQASQVQAQRQHGQAQRQRVQLRHIVSAPLVGCCAAQI